MKQRAGTRYEFLTKATRSALFLLWVGWTHSEVYAADSGCTLADARLLVSHTPPGVFKVDGQSITNFLPADNEGEFVLRQKFDAKMDVHVFHWRIDAASMNERNVLSVRQPPDKKVLGFLPADSTLIKFETPHQEFNPPWSTHAFLVLSCENSVLKSIFRTTLPVSNSNAIRILCALLLGGAYILFALTVWNIKNTNHPLATKYPAYEITVQQVGLRSFDPVFLTADAYNKGSIQKLQVLLFSFIVAGMLLSLSLRTGVLTDLSETIAALLGISAVGAAVGQATTTNRERLSFENWVWLVRKKVLPLIPVGQTTGPRWGDLVITNREFDIYKLQTLVFSAVVAITLLVSGESVLATFTVPQTLLGILGLSQIVYVAGVLVRPPSLKDLDEAVTKLRNAEANLQTVVNRNVDTNPDGKLPEPLPPAPSELPPLAERLNTAKHASTFYNKLADQVELMIESTFERDVERSKLDPSIQ